MLELIGDGITHAFHVDKFVMSEARERLGFKLSVFRLCSHYRLLSSCVENLF